MPSAMWFIEPVFLCREPLPPDKNNLKHNTKENNNNDDNSNLCALDDKLILMTCANRALVNIIRQLSCLSSISDKIFNNISSQCLQIQERSKLLQKRIDLCNEKVKTFNARSVKVPVGNLDLFAKIVDHFESKKDISTSLFTKDKRPQYVIEAYEKAVKMDETLKITCHPVSDNLLDIEINQPEIIRQAPKLPPTALFEKSKYTTIQREKDTTDNESTIYKLPSPQERGRIFASLYPSSYMSIDVSGSSFHRMSSFRRSLIHGDFSIKRRKVHHCKKDKRRNTIGNSTMIGNITIHSRAKSDPSLEKADKLCQTEPEEVIKSFLKSNKSNRCVHTVEVHQEDDKFINNKSNLEDNAKPSTSKTCNQFLPVSPLSVVKLREPSTNKGDDGRSSSGNWSASSSTHASVDSDQNQPISSNFQESGSNSSFGKDSIISEVTQDNDRNYMPNESNGYASDNSGLSADKSKKSTIEVIKRTHSKSKIKFANRDSESWSNYFEDSSDTITSENIANDNDKTQSPTFAKSHQEFQNDDEVESVYSVDTDGYYTSMHTDSGVLRDRPGVQLLITPNSSFRFKDKRGSITSSSTMDCVSINSILSRTDESSNEKSVKEKPIKVPPIPPTRTPSNSNGQGTFSVTSGSDNSEISGTKILSKTLIDSTIYPSMCNVTSSGSDLTNSSGSFTSSESKKRRSLRTTYKAFREIFNLKSKHNDSKEKSLSKLSDLTDQENSTPKASQNDLSNSKSNSPKSPYKKPISDQGFFRSLFKNEIKNKLDKKNEISNQSLKILTLPYKIDSKSVKVSLCPDGRILYPSNSLGRRRDGHPMNYSNQVKSETRFATLPIVQKPRKSSPLIFNTPLKSYMYDSSKSKSPSKKDNSNDIYYKKRIPMTLPKPNFNFKQILNSSKSLVDYAINRKVSSEFLNGNPSKASIKDKNSIYKDFADSSNSNDSSESSESGGFRKTDQYISSDILKPIYHLDRDSKNEYSSPNPIDSKSQSSSIRKLMNDSTIDSGSESLSELGLTSRSIDSNFFNRNSNKSKSIQYNDLYYTRNNNFDSHYIQSPNGIRQKGESSSFITVKNNNNSTFENYLPISNQNSFNNPTNESMDCLKSNYALGPAKPPRDPSRSFQNNLYLMNGKNIEFNKYQALNFDKEKPDILTHGITETKNDINEDHNYYKMTNGFNGSTCSRYSDLCPSESSEELASLINDSKKRWSIRNETSSSSPSPLTSPRSAPITPTKLFAGDRRSWSFESQSLTNLPGSRRSFNCERLKPLRPTSISDFKKLLSQVKISSNERISATEMLKLGQKRSATPMTLLNLGYNDLKETRTRIINGRVYRSPYRLEKMYPPIEETSEEYFKKSERDLVSLTEENGKKLQNAEIAIHNPKSTNTWV